PQDCGACCGDGQCGAGEGCDSCPQDCGACCGDGQCGAGEGCDSCPQDCGACCGDGQCGAGEGCDNCPQDCGCQAPEVCQANACVCVPQCGPALALCGDDGCGGLCDVCEPPSTCAQGRCRCDQAAPALRPTSLGFNYAPQAHIGKWMGSEFPLIEETFEHDLLTLASLNVKVVRLVALPYALGLRIEEGLGPNQWDEAELAAVGEHLPRIIQRFAEHNIRVIIAFAPNAYLWGGPNEARRWWQFVYGDAGWADFIQDLTRWAEVFIHTIERTSSCSKVLYYDLHNDVDYSIPQISQLVRAQLATRTLVDQKIGLSLRDMANINAFEADIQASGRQLGYVDFHVYPERGWNGDIRSHVETMRARFPQSRVLLGEVGSPYCENGFDETQQALTLSWIFQEGAALDLDAVLNWMLWDIDPSGDCVDQERVGLGFNSASPRDVYGWVVEARSALPGGDFEAGVNGWTAEGGAMTTLQISEERPTIHRQHLRLRAVTTGIHQACSPRFAITGERLAISGYLRANMNSLHLKARFYQGEGMIQELSQGVAHAPSGAFVHGVGRFSVPSVEGGVDGALICIGMETSGAVSVRAPADLEIDGVSVQSYRPR
ncbi:hypothetical protein KJ940_01930, partial [Myxococcota bacterium]|nr:hypothetical protein [Myxococcota bacterium]